VGELLSRIIDYQMFSVLLVDPDTEKLQHDLLCAFRNGSTLSTISNRTRAGGIRGPGKEAVLVPDVAKDSRYVLLNPETRSDWRCH